MMRQNISPKKSTLFRFFAWLQILLQVLFPLVSMVSHNALAQGIPTSSTNLSPFAVDRNTNSTTKDSTILPYADTMGSLATSLSSNGADGVANSAKSAATGYASSSAQQWLSQFGTARVQLNVDDNGNWDDSAIDFLAPLYDNKKSMLFTQLGLRAPDGRITGNMGMGVRTFYVENWMFGGNVFLDDDFTGKNRRVGFGAEAWTNNLKLSANTYVGTTDWHQSRDFDDYNEKPADGYDVRAEGYLPAYPQLGAKLMYEQYYGDKVALFDTDHLKSNPSAVTTGVSYTPIPLVQLAVNYKRGQDSMDDTQFQINFRYDLGRPLTYQLDPESVRLERSLAGSRYDLVERNNQIVLQYQKKDQQSVSNLNLQVIVDNSPSDGLTPNTAQVFATDKDGQPVRNAPIVWSTSGTAKLATSTSVTNNSGLASVNFTNTQPEAVQITAKSGVATATQNSQFNAATVSNVTLKITQDNSVADGKTANQALATITDINNHPIANTKVAWGLDAPALLKNTQTMTNASGQVTTGFTSTTAGVYTLTVTSGEKSASQQGHFAANSASNIIDTMVITKDNSTANGTTENTVNITVKDDNGIPVSNANVSLSADKSTVNFGVSQQAKAKSAKTFQTDAQGSLTIGFTDTVAETAQLTATLDNGNTKAVSSSFIADSSTAKVSDLTVTSGAVANGTATNQATVTVVDGKNNPLPDQVVTWTQDGTAVVGTSAKTDSNGQTTVTFTDLKAQTVNITATVNGSSQSKPSTFVADSSTAKVSALTVTSGAVANGTATNQATVTVVDANSNPQPDQVVTWSQDGTAVVGTSAKTDSNGQATVTFTDLKAETVNIAATVNGSSQSKPSTFVADSSTAKVSALTVTSGALANGTATNQATVTVLDGKNNPLPDQVVTWSQDGTAVVGTSAKTDSNGQTTVTFTDLKAETVNIAATVNGSSQFKPSSFVADSSTAKVSDLTVTSGAVANGTATNQATVTVVDANNNPQPDQVVTWTQDGTAVVGTSGKTDSNGQTTVTFTDLKAETVNITATVNSTSQSKPSSFIADSSTAKVSDLTVTSGAVANGTATNQATVTVVDGNSNPQPDQVVTWTQDGTAVVGTSAKTDSNGQATVTFTDLKAETVNITATVNGSSQFKPSTFVADTSTAKVSDLTVTSGAVANGTATNQATVTVLDGNSNPLPDQVVTWSQDGTAVVGTSAKTDGNGQTTVTFTDLKAETVNITATVNSTSQSKPSTFVADSSTAKVNDLTVTSGAVANGTATNQATVTVLDGKNNPLPDQVVTWSQDGTAVVGTSAKTDGNGQTTVTFTDLKAETVNITATVNGSSQFKRSSFVADASTAKVDSLIITKDRSPADDSTANTATAMVSDANGNPLPGMVVNWSADKPTVTVTANGPTDSTGQATVRFTDTTAETLQLTSSLSNGSTLSQTSEFIIDIAGLKISQFYAASGAAINDSTVLRLFVQDRFGKPVNGANVHLSVTGSAQLQSTSGVTSSTTSGNGTLLINITDAVVETVTATATLENNVSANAPVNFTQSLATAIVITITQDGKGINAPNTAVAKAVDKNGFPVPGYEIRWALGSYTSQFNFSAITGVTDQNGEVRTNIQSKSSSFGARTIPLDAIGESYFQNNPSGETPMIFAKGT
uniref:Ig-like domain-containing protein n=1 Tax=Hafnia alvei TaxID=569 RepID=UPI003F58FD69